MPLQRFFVLILLLPALLAPLDFGLAAEVEADRPRIGLVLGGGGARGATHIGVLRELERMRVPIDAIAGTSMGAFIGGLYASGLSASEIETVVTSVDWAAVMTDRPVRSETSYRRKEDDTDYPVDFELGLTGGRIRLPLGLIQGHSLELLLHELTTHASHIDDFDALPIPYRAVAADLEAAERYVIGHGSLPHAMRASMAVPGILAPTRVHGRLLGDGGLFANLPIDVVREMDVDVVIAVSAEFPLYAPAELDSALRISEQMVTILIRKDTQRQIKTLSDEDMLIVPDMGLLQSADFGNVTATIGPGEAATRAFEIRLSGLALEPAAYEEHLAARGRAATRQPESLAFVRVSHDGVLPDAALQARLRTSPGDLADPARLKNDADRLLGLGLYEQVTWHLVEENGEVGVEFEASTKSWGTNDLQFGISLLDDFDGDSEWGISARLNRVGLNRAGAEWRTDLELGSNPYLATEFYQPFTAMSDWFVAPGAALSRSNVNVNSQQAVIARRRVSEADVSLDIGRRFGNAAELRLGAFRGVGESEVLVGPPEGEGVDFETGGFRASLRADTLDNAHFPTRGLRSNLQWTGSTGSVGADVEFDTYRFDIDAYLTRGQSTYSAGLGYGTTSSISSLEPRNLLPLGGFLRLSGLGNETIRGPHTALGRFAYRRRIDRPVSSLFDTPTYVGVSLEAGNAWEDRSEISFDSALVHGSVFAGLDTYIGPVYLAAGFGEGGERAYYLFIGPPPR